MYTLLYMQTWNTCHQKKVLVQWSQFLKYVNHDIVFQWVQQIQMLNVMTYEQLQTQQKVRENTLHLAVEQLFKYIKSKVHIFVTSGSLCRLLLKTNDRYILWRKLYGTMFSILEKHMLHFKFWNGNFATEFAKNCKRIKNDWFGISCLKSYYPWRGT